MYVMKRQFPVKAPVHSGGSLSHSFMEQVPPARHHQEVGIPPGLISPGPFPPPPLRSRENTIEEARELLTKAKGTAYSWSPRESECT